MAFFYSGHFLLQIKERRISKKLAKSVYLNPEKRYFDSDTGHHIVIAKKKHAGKAKNIMVAYDIIGEDVTFVTSYPMRDKEIQNRVKRGRWKLENEKN